MFLSLGGGGVRRDKTRKIVTARDSALKWGQDTENNKVSNKFLPPAGSPLVHSLVVVWPSAFPSMDRLQARPRAGSPLSPMNKAGPLQSTAHSTDWITTTSSVPPPWPPPPLPIPVKKCIPRPPPPPPDPTATSVSRFRAQASQTRCTLQRRVP